MSIPTGYNNQTFTIEIEVTGALDGTTIGPDQLDAPADNDDPQQLYRSSQTNLGLIDLDAIVEAIGDTRRGSRGHRYIAFIWIEGPVPAGGAAQIDVVDAVDGTATQQKDLGTPVGALTFYREGVFLPQGSLLRVNGFSASGGVSVKVRVGFTWAADPQTIMLAQQAECTCEQASSSGDGFSRDTFSFSSDVDLDDDAGSDYYIIWSADTTENTAGFAGNVALFGTLVDIFGIDKIATRAGRFSRIAIRSSLALPDFSLFVEINGTRTFVVVSAALAAGATAVFDIESGGHVFPSTASLRFGLKNNPGSGSIQTDLNLDVELRYP